MTHANEPCIKNSKNKANGTTFGANRKKKKIKQEVTGRHRGEVVGGEKVNCEWITPCSFLHI